MSKSNRTKRYEDALEKFLEDGGKVEVCPPRRAAGISVGKLRSRFRHTDSPVKVRHADSPVKVNYSQKVKRKSWKGARAQLRD
jgi:hypothetical protein